MKRSLSSAILIATLVTAGLIVMQPARGVASPGILFGAAPDSTDREGGIAEIESQLDRQLDLVRVFERWNTGFPSGFHHDMLEDGRLLVVSVRPKYTNGTIIRWADIASAQPGSSTYDGIAMWADRMKDVGDEVWFTFHHEPEASGSTSYGNASQFIDAWRKVVDVFRARGATNVKFAWTMTHWSFEAPTWDSRYAANWYPGDAYVDLIGSDAYNWDKCRGSSTDTWRSLEDTINPQRLFGQQHPDKGLLLAELASTERPGAWGDGKADWINDAKELFKKPGWEQFVAISFFDVSDSGYPNCHWTIDSSPQALEALYAMADDTFYGGSGPDRFKDVGNSHGFRVQIEWLAAQGITSGCNPPGGDRFCPEDPVTREQMAAFLVRALGFNAGVGSDHFHDDDGSVFEADIDRIATAGVTKGCNPPTNTRYCPGTAVTRGQMAAFLVRAFGYNNDGGGDHFIDDDGSIFEGSIDRLATSGVTQGCNPPTNNLYCPDNIVTRGQMAAFLYRAMN